MSDAHPVSGVGISTGVEHGSVDRARVTGPCVTHEDFGFAMLGFTETVVPPVTGLGLWAVPAFLPLGLCMFTSYAISVSISNST